MRLRYAGFAEEETYDPDTAPAAVQHVDIASATLDAPADVEGVYEGGLGRAARIRRPMFYAPQGNIIYGLDVRTITRLLRWTLGGYVFTSEGGAGGLNLHEIHGVDDSILPSFTARLGKDQLEHVFRGCTVAQLALEVEDGFAMATVDVIAARDSKDDLQEIGDLLLPEEFPLTFVDAAARIAGTDRSADVKSFNLTVDNSAEVDQGRGMGQRRPGRIPVGDRETTFALSLFFGGTGELERFWGSEDGGPTDEGSDEFELELSFSAGAAGSLTFTLPRAWYTQTQQQPSGRDELVQTVQGRALGGAIELADTETEIESEILVAIENGEGDLTPS